MFELIIHNTYWMYNLITEYKYIVKIFLLSLSFTSFVLFFYHLELFKDIDFFLEHVDILGTFNISLYKFFMIIISIIPFFAPIVIIWSVFEGLDSRKFLKRFGCY